MATEAPLSSHRSEAELDVDEGVDMDQFVPNPSQENGFKFIYFLRTAKFGKSRFNGRFFGISPNGNGEKFNDQCNGEAQISDPSLSHQNLASQFDDPNEEVKGAIDVHSTSTDSRKLEGSKLLGAVREDPDEDQHSCGAGEEGWARVSGVSSSDLTTGKLYDMRKTRLDQELDELYKSSAAIVAFDGKLKEKRSPDNELIKIMNSTSNNNNNNDSTAETTPTPTVTSTLLAGAGGSGLVKNENGVNGAKNAEVLDIVNAYKSERPTRNYAYYLSRLQNGFWVHKYNYSNKKRKQAFVKLTKDNKSLYWSDRPKALSITFKTFASSIPVVTILGIIFGPHSSTFKLVAHKKKEDFKELSWRCTSVVSTKRTLDLVFKDRSDMFDFLVGIDFLVRGNTKEELVKKCFTNDSRLVYILKEFRMRLEHVCKQRDRTIIQAFYSGLYKAAQYFQKTAVANKIKAASNKYNSSLQFTQNVINAKREARQHRLMRKKTIREARGTKVRRNSRKKSNGTTRENTATIRSDTQDGTKKDNFFISKEEIFSMRRAIRLGKRLKEDYGLDTTQENQLLFKLDLYADGNLAFEEKRDLYKELKFHQIMIPYYTKELFGKSSLTKSQSEVDYSPSGSSIHTESEK